MTFVEYKMLNPFQRFGYNFMKFFKGIRLSAEELSTSSRLSLTASKTTV